MQSIKNLCLSYLDAFSSKDTRAIEYLLSDDVVLVDWEVALEGKYEIIAFFKRLFDSVTMINIELIRVFEEADTVIVEMEIKFDKENSINVVDIVRFNLNCKIESVVAYRR